MGRGFGKWQLRGMRFLFGVMKCSKIDYGNNRTTLWILIYSYIHVYLVNHWIIQFKWVNYSICELYLNKSIILKFVNEVLKPQNQRKRGIEKPKKQTEN